ncbi:MAG: nucleoside deaminase [Rhizomicrobium sp.]
MSDGDFLDLALQEARASFDQGGIPIGSVLVRAGDVIGHGHNQRVQLGDAIAHGEMDCIRNAGRQRTYKDTAIYTTLSPCMMCSGTIVQFGIPRVVIGENVTFGGNEDFLRSRGVEVVILGDSRCIDLMRTFQQKYPRIWNEDIGAD